jgi:peptidoglycan-N-acetylglucosamine deacetylase
MPSTAANPGRVVVALTFDFDGMASWIAMGAASPSMLSRGEFDAIGVRRLLDLLAEYDIQATFFTPGHTALAFPEITVAIRDAGHELAHHGWVHESPAALELDEERRVLERGLEALESVAGVRPRGYRSPSWENSPYTVELLLEYGFEYESSLMAHDFQPYWCRAGDRWSPTEPYEFGTRVPLVEIPVAWHLDDVPYFSYVHLSGLLSPGASPPSTVFEIWCAEFDYLHDSLQGGILTLTMHPHISARGYVIQTLRKLIEHFRSRPDVRFATCVDYARRWRESYAPALLDEEKPESFE